jgi:hypothetical protein
MSRIDQLRKENPGMNITIFDFFKKIDTTGTYKYFPILCRLFKEEYINFNKYHLNEIKDFLSKIGINTDKLTNEELIIYNSYAGLIEQDKLKLVFDFIQNMENNLIENKDVTSYKTSDDIRLAVSLSNLKKNDKHLTKLIHIEYEDDVWLILRPLTFESSSKYGASTKWCTTYSKDKQLFLRYWKDGALVYFINKKTGYKFAGFKDMSYVANNNNNNTTFWSDDDHPIDSMFLDVDSKIFDIIKKIFTTDKTNENLCSKELKELVYNECEYTVSDLRQYTVSDLREVAEPAPVNNHYVSDSDTNITLNVVYRSDSISDEET